MARIYQIRDGAVSIGSFSADQLAQMAEEGRLHAEMEIRRLPDGAWSPLSKVHGLHFKSPPPHRAATAVAQSPAPKSQAFRPPAPPPRVLQAASPPSPATATAPQLSPAQPPPVPASAGLPAVEVLCPFCSERIQPTAKKCKHCGEFLDQALRGVSAGNHAGLVPNFAATAPPTPATRPVDLSTIQMNRQRLVICLLLFSALQLLFALQFLFLSGWWPFFSAASWLFYYAGAVFAFVLAMKVYDTGMGLVLGLLGLIPYVGLIGMGLVNSRARSLVRAKRLPGNVKSSSRLHRPTRFAHYRRYYGYASLCCHW